MVRPPSRPWVVYVSIYEGSKGGPIICRLTRRVLLTSVRIGAVWDGGIRPILVGPSSADQNTNPQLLEGRWYDEAQDFL